MKNISLFLLMLMVTFSFGCKEDLVLNTKVEEVPVIESFEPTTGQLGDEITIKGSYLGEVGTIYFGDSLATIKYRVSGNELVAKLDRGSLSGKISAINNYGMGESPNDFSVNHLVPTIADFADVKMMPNGLMKIEGINLNAVYDVYFASSKANIVEANEDFFMVEVPFFEEDEEPANVIFNYNDNGTLKQAQSTGKVTLFRIFPAFTTIPDEGVTDKEIVFEGENLTLIDEVFFNEEMATIVSKTSEKLIVSVTDLQFELTTTGVTVTATYFGGTQVETLHDNFKVIVPTVEYYAGIKINPRGGEEPLFFLDFNTGLVYGACGDLTQLFENISLMAYSSKSGYLQLRQSGNASGVVKNYACSETGEKLPSTNSVKISKFGVLDENIPEQKAYIDAVKNKTLTDIDSDIVSNFDASKSDLDIYTTGTGNVDEFGPGDVIIVKQDWDGVIQYGLIEIVEAVADVPENIGQASGDNSYLKFNYYFQK